MAIVSVKQVEGRQESVLFGGPLDGIEFLIEVRANQLKCPQKGGWHLYERDGVTKDGRVRMVYVGKVK